MKQQIGVDIMHIDRTRKSIQSSDYLNYMFTVIEQQNADMHPQPVYYYASLFAIKEAAFKSMNIFWEEEMKWTDFVVHSSPHSHPTITLENRTREIAKKKKITGFSASNSYDKDYVIATVLCMLEE